MKAYSHFKWTGWSMLPSMLMLPLMLMLLSLLMLLKYVDIYWGIVFINDVCTISLHNRFVTDKVEDIMMNVDNLESTFVLLPEHATYLDWIWIEIAINTYTRSYTAIKEYLVRTFMNFPELFVKYSVEYWNGWEGILQVDVLWTFCRWIYFSR